MEDIDVESDLRALARRELIRYCNTALFLPATYVEELLLLTENYDLVALMHPAYPAGLVHAWAEENEVELQDYANQEL